MEGSEAVMESGDGETKIISEEAPDAVMLLAEMRADPVYGQFTLSGFDAAAFARSVIEQEAARLEAEGTGSTSYSAEVLAGLNKRSQLLETAIDAYAHDKLAALMRGAKRLGSLRRDVEAVEFSARDVRRRSRNMTRKLIEPYEACSRATSRLRTTFEASEVLRRAQRALFAVRRLREKRIDGSDLREMAKAASVVREIEELTHGERGAPTLLAIAPLKSELSLAAEARDRLRASSEKALESALDAGNQTDVAAALSLSRELGRLAPTVEAAFETLSRQAADGTKAALAGELGEMVNKLDRGSARALADDWARAIEACAIKASTLDRVLRKPRDDNGGSFWGALGYQAESTVDRVWAASSDSTRAALKAALCLEEPAALEMIPTPTSANAVEELFSTSSSSAKKAMVDLSKVAKTLLDETTQRSKQFVEQSKRTLLQQKSSGDIEAAALARVRDLAASLVDYYPVVRKSFLTMTARFGGGSTRRNREEVRGDNLASGEAGGLDDPDPLGSVARAAPVDSFVSLCEAQFTEIAAAHEATCYATNSKTDTAKRRAAQLLDLANRSQPSRSAVLESAQYAQSLDKALVRHRIKPLYDAAKAMPFGIETTVVETAKKRLQARKLAGLQQKERREEDDIDERHRVDEEKQKEPTQIVRAVSGGLEALVLGSLEPLCDGYLEATGQRLLEPVVLMFRQVEGYEAELPSKQDMERLVTAARKELRDVLEEGGESTLVPAVLEQVSRACREFATRATRALVVKTSRHKSFESLTEAVDRAARAVRAARSSVGARRVVDLGDIEPGAVRRRGEISDVRWRASASEEHDATIATLCAQLKFSLYKLRQLMPAEAVHDAQEGDGDAAPPDSFEARLAPGFEALEAVCERVAFASLDGVAYRVEVELARAHAEDYSSATEEVASPSLERALAALEAARVGYCAALPSWFSPGQFDSPSCRAAMLALPARVARSYVSHVALYRTLSGDGRLRVATEVATLDDALASYEPEDLPRAPYAGYRPSRYLASELHAVLALKAARAELAGLKRFLFAAEQDTPVVTILAHGAKLVRPTGPLRPSTVWHHVLASRGHDAIPMPHTLAEPERGGGSELAYVAWLVAGPHPSDQDSPAHLAAREADAWHDVQRCLDAWAQRASALGLASLGEVYDALQAHGAQLLASYKRALDADRPRDYDY